MILGQATGGSPLGAASVRWAKAHRAVAGVSLRAFALGSIALFSLLASTQAASGSLDANQLKAAYLYNFARYVEWPKTAHASSDSALEIGVVGNTAISDLLEKTVKGKTIGDRNLRVVRFDSALDAKSSHILFVAGDRSEKELKAAIEGLAGTHVFVVADADGFAKDGGIANFIISDSRVKFAINKNAANRAGLKVSSKLLRLAELVD